jgi:osmotically-inducible protein OsmY
MAVTPPTCSDARLQQEILAELDREPRVAPHEIGVIVNGAIATLTGRVDSYTNRWAAEDAAHRVRGVQAVANDIEIRWSPDDNRADEDIARSIVAALERDASVSIQALAITVYDGWVTLKGDVEWPHQKHHADRIVRWLQGVKGVSNLIVVNAKS